MSDWMIFLLLAFSVLVHIQDQFYLYDSIHNVINDNQVFYDCLYYNVSDDIVDYYYPDIPLKNQGQYQIIRYCVRPLKKYTIAEDEGHVLAVVSFDELDKENTTVDILLAASTPLYLVENYQDHLENPTNESSSQMFHVCFPGWFGSLCQYTFDSDVHSLSSVVRSVFIAKKSRGTHRSTLVTNLTCYTHLECNQTVSSICLDWREICDGTIHCLNDGVDEKGCFELETNQCNADEFQCHNGMCIPLSFVNDNLYSFDCLDGSDEGFPATERTQVTSFSDCYRDPAFRCEEASHKAGHPSFFCGDGQICSAHVKQCCENGRGFLLLEALLSRTENLHLTYDCWLLFYCATTFAYRSDSRCILLYPSNGSEWNYQIGMRCFTPFVVFPQHPVLAGHVRFMYLTNATLLRKSIFIDVPSILPDYVCYNEKLCPSLPNPVFIYNLSCIHIRTRNITTIEEIYTWFQPCFHIHDGINETYCRSPALFQCPNTSKCISKSRLLDGIIDCYGRADEMFDNSCELTTDKSRFMCTSEKKCIPWFLLKNGRVDCKGKEDEQLTTPELPVRTFTIFCNGYEHLTPVLIGNMNETDETNCKQWPCSNIYTRCDGAWTCLNGEDELECGNDRIECPFKHHSCVSAINFTIFCLPLHHFNDGIIDCLGAMDERAFCRKHVGETKNMFESYRCLNNSCSLPPQCGSIVDCDLKEKNLSNLCKSNPYILAITNQLGFDYSLFSKPMQEHFILQHSNQYPTTISKVFLRKTTYFREFLLKTANHKKNDIHIIDYKEAWFCNRGLPVKTGLNKTIRCFCPPSYYGSRCEFQNQRVSITLQFQHVCSPNCQGHFILLVSLRDTEGIIHSQEQIAYTSEHDCRVKFNLNLLYRDRPKNSSKFYYVHVDLYKKSSVSLTYHTSWYFPILFTFLPVNRIAALLTISLSGSHHICTKACHHGQCVTYENAKHLHFCLCNSGWLGSTCNIPYDCDCSPDSLCIGFENNQSRCLCSANKFGPRCKLFSNCHSNPCKHGGTCFPDIFDPEHFICRCSEGYSGPTCSLINNRLILSFDKIEIPQLLLAHYVTVYDDQKPTVTVIPRKIRFDEYEAVLYFSEPFHLVFIQIDIRFYSVVVQEVYEALPVIRTQVSPTHRCPSIRELLQRNWPLVRRIKYYHSICQDRPQLLCFHDEDTFMCLCTTERHANCFNFNFNQTTHGCEVIHECQNNAQCFQNELCPTSVMCLCADCFFGSNCRLTTNDYGLNFDIILGYQIRPHLPLHHQLATVKISFVVTILMLLIGIISGTASIMTFAQKKLRTTGCNIYLLGSSIVSVLIIIVFSLKVFIFLVIQIEVVTNDSFLLLSCKTIDFVLRSLLALGDWLNACVAIERTFMTIKGVTYDAKKSKRVARWIVLSLILFTFASVLHDPMYRHVIHDFDEHRIWCVTEFPPVIRSFDSLVHITHFFLPFLINVVSTVSIIYILTRRRSLTQQDRTYKQHLVERIRRHKHLIISPIILIVLALPRLIISFISKCMKSARNPWLYLAGYFISFIPPLLHLVVFILPSKTYNSQLYHALRLMHICNFPNQ